MRSIVIVFALAGVAGAGASTVLSAPEQVYPGQMTQARVWVQNRGSGEAVPVDLREVNISTPLRVQIVGGGDSPSSTVAARKVRQPWEYATVAVTGAADAANALGQRGAEGWETTGIAWTVGDTTTLLLKRPR
jgi:hypothetical protein